MSHLFELYFGQKEKIMMIGVTVIMLSLVPAAKMTANEIKMECRDYHDPPSCSNTPPSFLADLKVELVTFRGRNMLNISWAINIDVVPTVGCIAYCRFTPPSLVQVYNCHPGVLGQLFGPWLSLEPDCLRLWTASIGYLTATRIVAGGETYHCEYNPPMAKADLTGLKQKWFYYLLYAGYGFDPIQAANIPLPPLGSGGPYKYVTITESPPNPDVKPEVTSRLSHTQGFGKEDVPHITNLTSIILTVFGCLAGLMILSFSYIIYKRFRVHLAKSLDFKGCPSPMLPVPVLVVYPAENSTFQRAVVALTEFLQWQAGCSIAVDIWQQRQIAELGPMCWLAEQVKAANRVLIVCPQRMIPVSRCSSNYCFPTLSISAAAQDLYPLVLNMVVSHAKSSTDLYKFWVVQLGNQTQDKWSGNLAPELRACKTFCVMKDLRKLCRSLHEHRQDNKTISAPISRPWISYSEKSTMMLRKAVENIK